MSSVRRHQSRSRPEHGVLATQSLPLPGYPFVSIVPFVPDERHRPVFLIRALAKHTKNFLAGARMTILGDAVPFDAAPDFLAQRARYVAGFGEMGWAEAGDWADGAVLPMGIRLLGLDCHGVDIERQGCRERQQFPGGAMALDNFTS